MWLDLFVLAVLVFITWRTGALAAIARWLRLDRVANKAIRSTAEYRRIDQDRKAMWQMHLKAEQHERSLLTRLARAQSQIDAMRVLLRAQGMTDDDIDRIINPKEAQHD